MKLSRKTFIAVVSTIAFFASLTADLQAQNHETPAAKLEQEKPDSKQASEAKIKVLIVDGQNNHAFWPKTTIMMKQYLEESGEFTVDVARTANLWKGKLAKQFPLDDGKQYQDLGQPQPDPNYSPNFSAYDVVLSNFGFKAAPWPEETKANFEKFMKQGGGLVVVHAADNSWGDWKEYNLMIGLGGWGGRNEASGPYVYLDEKGKEIRDTRKGPGGAHGPQHPYQIVARNAEHPIMKGLPKAWLHQKDELYDKLRGPAENMTILATAWSDPKYRGTGRHEPTVMVLNYGKGRVFHTTMGHSDTAMECVGYRTLLLRGTQWAATGKVTLTEIPADFPSDNEPSKNAFTWKKTKWSKQGRDR